MTIYSIAQELGVSASTVSRAFSRPNLVRADLRDQILAVADRMGYAPNRAARGLATGRHGLVGLLVPDITNPFFPPLVRAVEMAAAQSECWVLFVDAAANGAAEPQLVRQLATQVDALVVASPRAESAALKEAIGSVPAVLINRTMRGIPAVVCDNSAALHAACDHLMEQGHRRFALLRGPEASWAAQRRTEAVRRWADRRSVEVTELGPFEAQFEDARAVAGDLVGAGVTAILAFDDLMAAGALAGLAALGVHAPADVSVVGCDDVLLARTMTPALTTVTAPIDELGRRAVELLSAVAEGQPASTVRLAGKLSLRGTTGPAPAAS